MTTTQIENIGDPALTQWSNIRELWHLRDALRRFDRNRSLWRDELIGKGYSPGAVDKILTERRQEIKKEIYREMERLQEVYR